MIGAGWQKSAEKLLRESAGPDAPAEMYLLDGDSLPAELQIPNCIGVTAWHLSHVARPWLEARGEWRGPGFAAIVFPSRVAIAHRVTMREVVDACCLYVAVHEFCHEVERVSSVAAIHKLAADNGLPRPAEPALAAWRAAESSEPAPPWHDHQQAFIRAACHLSFRAMQSGHWLPAGNIGVAGSGYGLSDVGHYRQALGTEAVEREGEPITSILATEPPAGFSELFARDCATWHASHPTAVIKLASGALDTRGSDCFGSAPAPDSPLARDFEMEA